MIYSQDEQWSIHTFSAHIETQEKRLAELYDEALTLDTLEEWINLLTKIYNDHMLLIEFKQEAVNREFTKNPEAADEHELLKNDREMLKDLYEPQLQKLTNLHTLIVAELSKAQKNSSTQSLTLSEGLFKRKLSATNIELNFLKKSARPEKKHKPAKTS